MSWSSSGLNLVVVVGRLDLAVLKLVCLVVVVGCRLLMLVDAC